MKYFKQLTAVFLATAMILPPAPLMAGTRKGDKLRNQARVEETRGNLEKALDLTNQAVAEDPSDPAYLLQMHRIRFELGVQHIGKARRLREAGKLDEALAEYQKAAVADPSSDIAMQEIVQTQQMIEREKNGGKSPADGGRAGAAPNADTKSLTPAAYARREQQQRTNALQPVPILRPLKKDMDHLKMTNRPRTLFETWGALAGVNVVFDPDYNSQQNSTTPIQLDLPAGTSIEAALDEICLVTKSFWKPIPDGPDGTTNTIFISFDNRNNRTQYTDQVVKVFYLSNITTAQEMTEMLTVLRTIFDITKVFQYNAQNAIIVRCDSDTMALVEKEIAALDKPRAEVVIDVMVMQVSSSYSRQVGAGVTGINTSGAFAPRASITTPASDTSSSAATTSTTTSTTSTGTTGTGTTTTPGAAIPFSQLGHISSADYSISNLPGATFEAMLSDSTTRVLQAPQIRSTHNSKASIKIGEKIPIATGSFQSAVGAVGALPAANTQFSFQDVGVTLEVQPQIHENSEVSLHLDITVSQVIDRINVGGVSEPEIGENKITNDIRLREGEVSLIGGIVQNTNSKSLSGLPGLSHVPLLGRLFSNEDTERNKTELVIALSPHIVRNPDITASDLRGVSTGTANQIKVTYDTSRLPVTPPTVAETSVPATGNASAPVAGPLAVPASATAQPPATAPVMTAPVTAPPATAPPATAPPATAPPATAPASATPMNIPGLTVPPVNPLGMVAPRGAGAARIMLQPTASTASLNSALSMTIYAENVTNLAEVNAQLQYDPQILRITNIVAGDLPGRNIPPPEVSKTVGDDTGRAEMRVARGANTAISGSGSLFTVLFQAVGRGNTSVTVTSVGIGGPAGPVAATMPAPAAITIQ
jgi:general secretion pathway protein D